jgi:hypothetical protein
MWCITRAFERRERGRWEPDVQIGAKEAEVGLQASRAGRQRRAWELGAGHRLRTARADA